MKRKIHVSLWVGFITCCNCCYALRPEKEYKYTPEQFGLEYKAIKIETIDNYKIYTWSFTPKVSAFNGKTIIVANSMGTIITTLSYPKIKKSIWNG